MLTRAEFSHYRGFERMRIDLAPNAYIVGPNSAGKSTVIESISFAEQCLQRARRKAPTIRIGHRGESRRAYRLPLLAEEEGAEDPIRHDFGTDEARASIYWEHDVALHAVWPEQTEDDEQGFFYLETAGGLSPRSIAAVRELFPPAYVVPVVTPIDRVEEMKGTDYVRRLAGSRLASRHFRNHAYLMQQEGTWDEFRTFAEAWLPELELLDVDFAPSANQLRIFYRERGSRVPKELAWAGDGIQIWVQLIWHVFRARQARSVVLDEPEVYLHPDLQRRLVRLLETLGGQVILASHSADVIAEAPPESLVWIDRHQRRARRLTSQRSLAALSASLGSSFNIALARSGRASLIVASDADAKVLRQLAKQVGATRLAQEHAVEIVQLREVGTWVGTERLGETLRELIPSAVPAAILLARGHRPDAANEALAERLAGPGNQIVFWSRAELENFLLAPQTIARASGAAPEAVEAHLSQALDALRASSRAEFTADAVRYSSASDSTASLSHAEDAFEQQWLVRREDMVRGSLVVAELNVWLEREGYRTISALTLAKAVRVQELAPEVFSVLLAIDERAS